MQVSSPENTSPEPITQEKIETLTDTTAHQNPEVTKEGEEDPNWRAFREARKQDRAHREAAEKRAAEKEAEVAALKAAMETAFSKSSPSPEAYNQYYGTNQPYEHTDETEDQRIEKKVNKLLSERENKYRKEKEEQELREYPTRLHRELPDFANVTSQENLDYLDYHFPELSRPLQRLPEGYEKWYDIYHAVKKFIPNQNSAKRDSARAEANSNKPKSMSTTQLSQPGQASTSSYQEVEQRRAENWSRMQRMIKSTNQ
jgi:hypothetical protein